MSAADSNPFGAPQHDEPEQRSRRELLPRWIRVCSWIFYIIAWLYPVGLVLVPEGEFAFLGLSYEGNASDPGALPIHALYACAGTVGYRLLWERRWAIDAGIAYGAVVICASILDSIRSLGTGTMSLHLESILVVIFVLKLLAIRDEWRAFPPRRMD